MICRFFSSTVGKKVIVAATGFIMFGFLVGHMAGNLLAFEGREALNRYSAMLHFEPAALWAVRLVLLTSVILHIVCTIQLAILNKAARPIGYQVYKKQAAVLGSTFMVGTGLFIAAYIVYHLLHLTFGTVHPSFNEHDVYSNVITGFQVVWSSVAYIVAMICIGFHLNHGVRSMFQTLGLNHPKYNKARAVFAMTVAVVIPAGFISIPVAVLAGILK